MNDGYGGYFDLPTPTPEPAKRRAEPARPSPDGSELGWNGPRLPPCTNTAGDGIKRLGFESLKRVMDRPVNPTSAHPEDYAQAWCEALGVGIIRHGTTIRSATFSVFTFNGFTRVFKDGAEGRDAAIKFFLKLLRKRRHYYFPRKSDAAGK